MTDFYLNYQDLCKEKNLQPVSDEAANLWGVSKAAISGWKNKDSMPSYDAMFKMMEYFDIAIPVLESREMFLNNQAFYVTYEAKSPSNSACIRCTTDINHYADDIFGFNMKQAMLIGPDAVLTMRAATKEEIEDILSDDGFSDRERRYKIVSQAEASRAQIESIRKSVGMNEQ